MTRKVVDDRAMRRRVIQKISKTWSYDVAPDEEWRERAACRDHPNPNLWDPPPKCWGNEAKVICQRCPVRAACLEYAMERPQAGVWGGLTESERRRLAKTRRRAL